MSFAARRHNVNVLLSNNTNRHLVYVVGRISLARMAKTRRSTTGMGPEKSSGLRRRMVVSRSIRRVVESTTTGLETLMIPVSTDYLKTLWDVTHELGRLSLRNPCCHGNYVVPHLLVGRPYVSHRV